MTPSRTLPTIGTNNDEAFPGYPNGTRYSQTELYRQMVSHADVAIANYTSVAPGPALSSHSLGYYYMWEPYREGIESFFDPTEETPPEEGTA